MFVDYVQFIEILIVNSKSWMFNLLTMGTFGIITLAISIFPIVLNEGMFAKSHYLPEILSILTQSAFTILAVIGIVFQPEKKYILKICIIFVAISYLLLIFAAVLESK